MLLYGIVFYVEVYNMSVLSVPAFNRNCCIFIGCVCRILYMYAATLVAGNTETVSKAL